MCTTHVLALTDFTKTFFLEFDSYGRGIGAVLMQDRTTFVLYYKTIVKETFGPINI
jgi:hypothetical protein